MKELGYIQLTMKLYKDKDGRWVGECVELGTSNYGDTIEEAEEQLDESVQLHLNTLEMLGERDRFFQENNIKVYKSKNQEIDVNLKGIDPNVFIKSKLRHLEYA
jgi:predicted RNase H-like HicB family nuclease